MFPDPAAQETIHLLDGFVDLQGYVDVNIYAVCPLQQFFQVSYQYNRQQARKSGGLPEQRIQLTRILAFVLVLSAAVLLHYTDQSGYGGP